jgi:sugar (pentulose or hexulose) kinase
MASAQKGKSRPDLVAVLDVGKTNVKLNAVSTTGDVIETLSVPNSVLPGPPWKHHDLEGLSGWIFGNLAGLCRRHPITTFVATGHGSGGMLTGADPDAGDGTVLPMIDYEQPPPDAIRDGYAPLCGTFFDRGSAVMLSSTHQARQIYWMESAFPKDFARARWFLGIPQYWAWRMSGRAVSEATFLGAQSHLWNVAEQRWSPIVTERGWKTLMPPIAKAWTRLGPVRPELARRHGFPPALQVLAGGHDSSLNYYRYQAAGLESFTTVSTGTWIVGFSGQAPLEKLDEHRGMTCNSDVYGRPLGGALTMGGREFAHVAGPNGTAVDANPATIEKIIRQGTMALPSFSNDDGLFPGSAGKGRIVGPAPVDATERTALAILYTALLTLECLDALGADDLVVLDGSFLRNPLYSALVAALRPGYRTLFSLEPYGVASGAALLATHETRPGPVTIALRQPEDLGSLGTALLDYATRWRALSHANAIGNPDTAPDLDRGHK